MNAKPRLAHCLVTLGAALALGASAATRGNRGQTTFFVAVAEWREAQGDARVE